MYDSASLNVRHADPRQLSAGNASGSNGRMTEPHRRDDGQMDQLRRNARQILAEGKPITAGCIHLIGLSEIRDSMGPRWDAAKERVHHYAHRVLERMLSPGDLWFRHGESDYVVVFARLDKTAAQLVCGKIVATLHESLLGNNDFSRIRVTTAVLQIDGEVLMETTRLDDLLARAAAEARAGAAQAPETAGRTGSADPLDDEVPIRRLSLPQHPPPPPSVVFRPYFDAKKKVISTYVCRPGQDTEHYLASKRTGDLHWERAVVGLDHEALATAVEVYADLYANKFRYAQTIPIHYDTLAVLRHRRNYIEQCRMIPAYLTNFLAFELQNLPIGIPYGRLSEIVAMLRPFCRAVIAQLPEEAVDLVAYSQAGIKGVGTVIDPMASEVQAADQLHAFGIAVRKAGLFAYVDGVRSAAMLRAAEDSGILYIAGPVVGPDADVPEHVHRCTEREMVERNHRSKPHNR